MEDDRHLMAAEMPSTSPDVLIVEATYGVQVCVCVCVIVFRLLSDAKRLRNLEPVPARLSFPSISIQGVVFRGRFARACL